MGIGKLPSGISEGDLLSVLNLEPEELLYACLATEVGVSGSQRPIGIFVFAEDDIYWLNDKTLELQGKQSKSDILNIKFSIGSINLDFTHENWKLTSVEKADKKALEAICSNAYLKIASNEPTKAKSDLAPERTQRSDDRYGEIVVTAKFGGMKKVSLHSKGYVSGICNPPEKLIAITGSADVAKKSGLGRGLGIVATAGLSTFGSNMRGDVYVTIVTNVKTHTIHVDMKHQPSGQNPVGEMQKLLATGEALLAQNTATVAPAPTPSTDLATQLSNLSDLHKSGVLSDAEFNAAKAKILGT